MTPGYTISAPGDTAENMTEVGQGSRTSITLEKIPGLPLRAAISTYPRGEVTNPARVEWGPLAALAPRLRRTLGLTASGVSHELMKQRAPLDFVMEARAAMTEGA